MTSQDRHLVPLGTFASSTEAEVVRARLESHGIVAMVRQDDAGGMLPELSWRNGPQVVVRAEDLDRAREVLGQVLLPDEEGTTPTIEDPV
ncbi:MAG: hypothetical protein GEU79_00740 [Acidimicrobiia bacterium]|nr:hypothetical protein [Acidimicrobiia bacterium]